MSRIKNKDTKPEILVRKFLFSRGMRYQLHRKDLPGKPDLVFTKYSTVLFVNGCYWHGHEGCRYFVLPKTRTDWWLDKINRNIEKDKENISKLNNKGWNVITVWECELKPARAKKTLGNLEKQIKLNNGKL